MKCAKSLFILPAGRVRRIYLRIANQFPGRPLSITAGPQSCILFPAENTLDTSASSSDALHPLRTHAPRSSSPPARPH